MFFLKRNFTTIVIFTLLIGSIGTIVAAFFLPQKYDYEEYYIFDEQISESQYIELKNSLASVMSEHTDSFTVKQQSGPSRILLEVNHVSEGVLNNIKEEFEYILDNQNLSYSTGNNTVLETKDSTLLQIIVILLFLFIGLLFGLLVSLGNRRINTDEDIEYYLGQKTLGTF